MQISLSIQFRSVQFTSVMSNSLQPHELQHARPPCPSPIPRVHSESHPSSQWCHPAISSSVVPFSSCPQSLPASESFPMSQLFAWGGQSFSFSWSFSFSIIPSKEIPGLISFKMDWLDLLAVQGTLKSLLQHHRSKASILRCSAFLGIAFLWDWNENCPFQSCGHCWLFQTCCHIECSTFTASSFRIWNSSTGIPSPPLALFVVMLPKAHLTSHSKMPGSRWVITHHSYLSH